MPPKIHGVLVLAVSVALAPPAMAQEQDLTKLALEDLLKLEVTSVARKSQTLARTAAAVYVISQEDIRRSGAQTIPDLLRMVPGFSVAQIDAGSYAIGARGFTGMYSNKLLVLVDGRSVYTPMFGGVHWDMQNLPLDEIDRIEVIRGPGGSIWGANATNGVVNIITKPARLTQGTRIGAVTGGDQRADLQVRHGDRLEDAGHYKLYARHVEKGWSNEVQGVSVTDPGDSTIAGGRVDWMRGGDRFALHGSAQQGVSNRVRHRLDLQRVSRTPVAERTNFRDANVVFSWTRELSASSEFGVQAYYEHLFRGAELVFDDLWHTADVDARYRRALGRRHDLVAGGGIRLWSNTLSNHWFQVLPEAERLATASAFAQDEIELVNGRLWLTAGIKLEHNRYTTAGFQPSARLTWAAGDGQSFWAAASRALRTSSRTDRGLILPTEVIPGPFGVPMVLTFEGNEDFDAEVLDAFEAGYRVQRRAVAIDVAAFVNQYDQLQTAAPGPIGVSESLPGVLRLPMVFFNGLGGRTTGAEVAGTWSITHWWKVIGSYSLVRFAMDPVQYGGADAASGEGTTPHRQAHVRFYLDLPKNLEGTLMVFRVGALEGVGIPAYTRVDLRVAWTRGPAELAAGAQNLGHRGDQEFVELSGVQSSTVTPRAYVQVGVRF